MLTVLVHLVILMFLIEEYVNYEPQFRFVPSRFVFPIQVGGRVFLQIFGFSMVSGYTPFQANLFLFSYEVDFIRGSGKI